MTPLDVRNELRRYLNSGAITIADVERSTRLGRSWLSKFRRGEIQNPTIKQLQTLHRYRESNRGAVA
jgi:transcriptional regulator with XRE-family HTH domain